MQKQIVILLVFVSFALLVNYFVVREGFSDSTKQASNQSSFPDLIDKLTFFSTASVSVPAIVSTTTKKATTPEEKLEEEIDKAVRAAESTDRKKYSKKTEAAPAGTTAKDTIHAEAEAISKDIAMGPKDTANVSIAERSKKPVLPTKASSTITNALRQGKEFFQSGYKPTPTPRPCPTPKPVPFPCNSSDYIRKDQIPCWGCTLK